MSPSLNFEVVPMSKVSKEDVVDLSKKTRPLVLVVDDERVIADTLSIILSQSGFATLTAYDGASGLELAEQRKPDLLISDVVMPELSGIDLAIQMQASHPSCRVLLFSGQAATANLLDIARGNGHNFEVLSKPIHPTEFLQKIKKVTAGA